jgi:ubiquinone/menaquinone biosynthesis C-methylase UbiE
VYGNPDQHAYVSSIVRRHSLNQADIRVKALDAAGVRPGWSSLELGCGFGGFTEVLAPRLGAAGTVVGVDLHLTNGEAFLKRARAAGCRVEFLSCHLPMPLPWPSESFDLVVSAYSFYFFPEMLDEVHRLLKPNGVFLALTHSVRNLGEVYVFFQTLEHVPRILEVVRRFSSENGEGLLRRRFDLVERVPFANRLRFGREDVEELLAYLRFKRPFWEGACDPVLVEEGLRRQIEAQGKLTLNKDDAIFISRKA